uniref:Uncharacterized protein n=1 Tax=Triticum urartu TaxID=4572 RepID=A0A8R7UZ31_TRIUA
MTSWRMPAPPPSRIGGRPETGEGSPETGEGEGDGGDARELDILDPRGGDERGAEHRKTPPAVHSEIGRCTAIGAYCL